MPHIKDCSLQFFKKENPFDRQETSKTRQKNSKIKQITAKLCWYRRSSPCSPTTHYSSIYDFLMHHRSFSRYGCSYILLTLIQVHTSTYIIKHLIKSPFYGSFLLCWSCERFPTAAKLHTVQPHDYRCNRVKSPFSPPANWLIWLKWESYISLDVLFMLLSVEQFARLLLLVVYVSWKSCVWGRNIS